MKLWILLTVISATAFAQGVRITWVGQACYVIQTSNNGPVVITDPPATNLGYIIPTLNADAVTITHNHSDHNFSAGVKGNFTLVDGRPATARQEVSAAGTTFVIIPGFHDNTNGAARGQNSIIRWNQGGLRFAHFGDFGQDTLTSDQLADLTDLDVVFMPGGGGPTISGEGAARIIQQLKPKAAILMHFRTGLGGAAQTAAFPEMAVPFAGLKFKPSNMDLSKEKLPATTEIWVLEVAADSAVVNAASSTAGAPVAPGSLASVFGTFTGVTTQAAASFPLSTTLNNVQVLIADKPVPLLFVSANQINVQVPGALVSSQQVVEVRLNGQRIARTSVTLLPSAPGLFAAIDQNGKLLSATNPVRRGQVISIFGTGQGAVSNPVADGAASLASPLARTVDTPGVYIDGRLSPIQFSGLAPGFPGLWQINAVVPNESGTRNDISLVVIQGPVSNELTIAVQN